MSTIVIMQTMLKAAPVMVKFTPDAPDYTHEPCLAPPELAVMQELVGGGMVEHVDTWQQGDHPVQVYVNEEGRLKGFRPNVMGTEFLRTFRSRWRGEASLVGPVIVLIGNDAIWK